MKETYYWVPWFKELSRKVAEYADGRQRDFLKVAKSIDWADDGKVAGQIDEHKENFDPFTFLYTVASKNNMKSREKVYRSISNVFELQQSIREEEVEYFVQNQLIFPTPTPQNLLFWQNDRLRERNPQLLWRLLKFTVNGLGEVNPDDFSGALKIPNVGVTKFTETLALINASEFLSADQHLLSLKIDQFERVPDSKKKHEFSLETYIEILDSVKKFFPDCKLYEIGLFAYKLSTEADKFQPNLSKYFQVSTNAFDDGVDRWEDFLNNNCVFTGGPYPQLIKANIGSVVFVRNGEYDLYGIGVVSENEYLEFNGWADNRKIQVIWINKHQGSTERSGLRRGFSNVNTLTLEKIEVVAPYRRTLDQLRRINPSPPPMNIHPKNQILYGPPGTGKTWHTVKLSLAIVLEKKIGDVDDEDREEFKNFQFDISEDNPDYRGQIAFTTFHQNYAYEDFIEGIRPTVKDGDIGYEIRDGIFKKLAIAAKDDPDKKPYVLIIDEINRGNIAKIFGELITLIEDSKRLGAADAKEVILPYSQKSFGVPPNLYIIGTMNTADRSIQILDTALRRRFTFFEMMPETSHPKIPTDIEGINCQKVLESMNRRIFSLLDRERQIGHTYFFGIKTIIQLADVFQNRIIPLLQEYFFDDWSKIKVVLGGNKFIQEEVINDERLDDNIDSENKYYRRLPVNDKEWTNSENYIQIYQI